MHKRAEFPVRRMLRHIDFKHKNVVYNTRGDNLMQNYNLVGDKNTQIKCICIEFRKGSDGTAACTGAGTPFEAGFGGCTPKRMLVQ